VSVKDQIRDILAAHGRLAVDAQSVEDDADLYELGLTSHASVNVMLALEDEFDVEFPDEDLKKATFATVGSLEAVVSKLLAGVA
jgi:acyl carrier protein